MASGRQINASDPVEIRRAISLSASAASVNRVNASVASLAARVTAIETGAAGSSTPSVVSVVTTAASSYSPTSTDTVILCNASGAGVTVNLPAAASSTNRMLFIKKIDSSSNAVTIDGNSGETIDGATTKSTTTQYVGWQIVCDGTSWHIL